MRVVEPRPHQVAHVEQPWVEQRVQIRSRGVRDRELVTVPGEPHEARPDRPRAGGRWERRDGLLPVGEHVQPNPVAGQECHGRGGRERGRRLRAALRLRATDRDRPAGVRIQCGSRSGRLGTRAGYARSRLAGTERSGAAAAGRQQIPGEQARRGGSTKPGGGAGSPSEAAENRPHPIFPSARGGVALDRFEVPPVRQVRLVDVGRVVGTGRRITRRGKDHGISRSAFPSGTRVRLPLVACVESRHGPASLSRATGGLLSRRL